MYLFLSFPIFILNAIFAYQATKRLIQARSFSKYPFRIDIIFLMILFSLPSSFGVFVIDLFSAIDARSVPACLIFAIANQLNRFVSVLLIAILVHLIGVFSNKFKSETLEKINFVFLVITAASTLTILFLRVTVGSEIRIFSKEIGSVDYCALRNDTSDLVLLKLSHANIFLSFTVSIVLFIYENFFAKTKNEQKRNNIIFSYFLMGLNQLAVFLALKLTEDPMGSLWQNVKSNIIYDLTRLRTFFLSLIVLYFEGRARVNLELYPIKRILQTKELSELLKTYTKRVKNKKLGSLVSKWENLQCEKKARPKCSTEEIRAFEKEEKTLIKALELEGFYGFVLADEFLDYALRMQRAGKSELDIN